MMTNLYRKFVQFFRHRFLLNSIDQPKIVLPGLPYEPDIHFKTLSIVEKTPGNEFVNSKELLKVIHNGQSYWVLFRCPCSCGDVVALSLQAVHNPKWSVLKSSQDRPTITPSIWRTEGCFSHFWIFDGRIYWCDNSGTEPWLAEPQYYSKPAD